MKYALCRLRKHQVERRWTGDHLFYVADCYTCGRRWKNYRGLWIWPSSLIPWDREPITWPRWSGPDQRPPLWRYMHAGEMEDMK